MIGCPDCTGPDRPVQLIYRVIGEFVHRVYIKMRCQIISDAEDAPIARGGECLPGIGAREREGGKRPWVFLNVRNAPLIAVPRGIAPCRNQPAGGR